METQQNFRFIGHTTPRKDGVAKVTGSAQFVHDTTLPGMLYGKLVRSPHASARIVRIDTKTAEAMPGVRAVLVGGELNAKIGLYVRDKDILARNFVRYQGEAVAAVAATEEWIAEEACRAIRVEYEVLQPVLDPRQAMQPDAPWFTRTWSSTTA